MVANPRRWTYGAVECYKIGCMCSRCNEVPDDVKKHCKMKFAVIELVKKYGRPTKEYRQRRKNDIRF